MLLGGGPSDLRVGPGAETSGDLPTDVELDVGITHQQCLGIGVERDELDTPNPGLDHAIHRIDATAADADDFDHGEIPATSIAHGDLQLKLRNQTLKQRFTVRHCRSKPPND